MTLDEGIKKAELFVDKSLIPARSTVSSWINKGAITKPLPNKRENLGRGGGMRDIFNDDLPAEIAVISYLKGIEKISITDIAIAKKLTEGTSLKEVLGENVNILSRIIRKNVRAWVYYFFKTKNGFKLDETVKVTGECNTQSDWEIKNISVEKSDRPVLTITYLQGEIKFDEKYADLNILDLIEGEQYTAIPVKYNYYFD